MTTTNFIYAIGLSLSLIACGQTPSSYNIDKEESKINSNEINKASISERHIDQMIFGIFCGECSHDCATMYRYNMQGNQNSLFVDHTDSYFKNQGKLNFATEITDKKKFAIAAEIVKNIPNSLLTTKKNTETFGCPDCSDGCGIYFEIQQCTTNKKFYIDCLNLDMPKEIKKFAECIKTNIQKL